MYTVPRGQFVQGTVTRAREVFEQLVYISGYMLYMSIFFRCLLLFVYIICEKLIVLLGLLRVPELPLPFPSAGCGSIVLGRDSRAGATHQDMDVATLLLLNRGGQLVGNRG